MAFRLATAATAFACALPPALATDFNGDGRQDLVWRNHSGNAVVWQMNGLSIASRTTLAPALDAASAIVGSGNFFGSGTGAIEWVDSNHQFSLWKVVAGSVAETCSIAGGIDPGWSFLGSGDLDADGIDDLAWRAADGSVHVLVMNGCTVTQSVTLSAIAGSDLTFLGIGDVDGHSAGTLFWRVAGGDVALWRLRSGFGLQSTTIKAGSYAGWSVAAIGDFDGDGRSDLLWRSGTQAALWFFNGTKYTDSAVAPGSASVFAEPDSIFSGNFDDASPPAPPLSTQWTILGASDLNGDGRADVVLADTAGDTAFWQMQGATIQSSGFAAPDADMPYTALTGWRMAMDRPSITKINNQVTVDWTPVNGVTDYVVYASAGNFPAQTGVGLAAASPPLQFGRNDAGYADKRYFAVSARYLGIETPASPEAFIPEFDLTYLDYYGSLAVADINGDGCLDVMGAFGNCHGGFTRFAEADVGLGAILRPGGVYRDLRFADFNGDGILDAVSNVYDCDVPECGGNNPASQILLFFGTGDGTYVQDESFTNLNVPGGGYGETIVVADFNNDGYLDILLPKYTFYDSSEHNFLLINDGTGHFSDAADAAGVAMRDVPQCARPEGAQAVDINEDGRIDLYLGSHLFLNAGNSNGVPAFTDLGGTVDAQCIVLSPSVAGIPPIFDEGAKFFDLDNSGRLALALDTIDSPPGIRVLQFDGISQFVPRDVMPDIELHNSVGINAADIDGDGLSDLVVSGGFVAADPSSGALLPKLFVNRGGSFVQHDFYNDGLTSTTRPGNDLQAPADFDGNGSVDWTTRCGGLCLLASRASSADVLTVRVVGAAGEENQAGRVVHVSPDLRPGTILTQVVDGGSGYMTNAPYELTFATPYPGNYTVSVRFASATYFTKVKRGQHLTLRADGTFVVSP